MKRIDVPRLGQGELPTGCELVTATMLLRYLGLDIPVEEFIRRAVPLQAFERRDGELWGPDPRQAFCGDPRSADGMGCYAPVLCRALEAVLADVEEASGRRYEVVDETGTSMEELCARYIDRDMPVIFWACIGMRPPIPGPSWRLLDSGERFEWTSNEHCLLLVGYDAQDCFFNDPLAPERVVHYPKELCRQRHAAQHSMAVALRERRGG